jgi:tRNA G46 methylase TrmB
MSTETGKGRDEHRYIGQGSSGQKELAPYLLDTPGSLDWQTVFGNTGPVEVEVGFGKGLSLLTAAGVNFLGIEIAGSFHKQGKKIYRITYEKQQL